MNRAFAVLAAVLLASPAAAQESGGARPLYTDRALSSTPLDAAIRVRHWAPGLNEGYVPQGLAMAQGSLFLGAYHSTDPKVSKGRSRIFAVDPVRGSVTGGFDLPESVGHADGLAATADGRTLYLADSGRCLYAFDLRRSLAAGKAVVTGTRRLDKQSQDIGSNFLTFDGERLWFGRYAKEGRPQLVAAMPARLFGSREPLAAADAERSIPLPLEAQGATFDVKGRLWVSTSGGRSGRLYRLDPTDGRILAEHPAMAGIEDLAPGDNGLLWSVSEAGSQRWNNWATFFPILFAFDPEALR